MGPTDNISEILHKKNVLKLQYASELPGEFVDSHPSPPIATFWGGSENLHFSILFDSEAGGP